MTTSSYYTEYGDAPEEYMPDGTQAGTFDGTAQSQKLAGESGFAGVLVVNFLYGEALNLKGSSRRGNDVLTGGDEAYNNLLGEASNMEASQGGNDVLTGGDNAKNYLYGEAYAMDYSQGGNDVLTGGDNAYNTLLGDASYMDASQGGNDKLTGGTGARNNDLYGDAFQMNTASSGGNDVLIAGDDLDSDSYVTTNNLYGDAYKVVVNEMDGPVICGNDRLVSGTGNDAMWGDFAEVVDSNDQPVALDPTLITTGHDVFVFSENNGQDTIYNFHRGEDKIELRGIADVSVFVDLNITQQSGTSNTIITFGINDTITLIGVTQLEASDFTFA